MGIAHEAIGTKLKIDWTEAVVLAHGRLEGAKEITVLEHGDTWTVRTDTRDEINILDSEVDPALLAAVRHLAPNNRLTPDGALSTRRASPFALIVPTAR